MGEHWYPLSFISSRHEHELYFAPSYEHPCLSLELHGSTLLLTCMDHLVHVGLLVSTFRLFPPLLRRNEQVAPPTAASIVANGVNGKASEPAPETKPAAEEAAAAAEDTPKVEAKEDGEEVTSLEVCQIAGAVGRELVRPSLPFHLLLFVGVVIMGSLCS